MSPEYKRKYAMQLSVYDYAIKWNNYCQNKSPEFKYAFK